MPLDALPHVPDDQIEIEPERNPFEPREPLQAPVNEIARRYRRITQADQAPQRIREQGEDLRAAGYHYGRPTPTAHAPHGQSDQHPPPDDVAADLVRTALCIEPRDGRLYCFIPPLTHLEHWLELVACIEATAEALGTRIIIEGYEPPSDLFSGMSIGPTSQAPRVDDALYNLEIAFQQMPAGEVPQPWVVDRVLRNLLADVTGNTHRTEFCIDKLYSQDSAAGRQGLVEFRGFEMSPHARMSLAQMLLRSTEVSGSE